MSLYTTLNNTKRQNKSFQKRIGTNKTPYENGQNKRIELKLGMDKIYSFSQIYFNFSRK